MRWHHRYSTDIDLFTDANLAGEFRKKDLVHFQALCSDLTELASNKTIRDLRKFQHGCSFESPHGPVSLFASRRFTRNAQTNEIVESTGIFTESNTEILFKKLYGRVIRSVTYTGRDMYDFVVAYMFDPNSLNRAFKRLEDLNLLQYQEGHESYE